LAAVIALAVLMRGVIQPAVSDRRWVFDAADRARALAPKDREVCVTVARNSARASRDYKSLITSCLLALCISACGDDTAPSPPAVTAVSIAPSTLALVIGGSDRLTATARDAGGAILENRTVSWTSSDPAVATVAADGTVSGINVGSTVVSAAIEGMKASVPVTVSRPTSTATFASVTAGGAHTCGLTSAGAAYCWGRGESGQLGVAPPTTVCTISGTPFPCRMTPVLVDGGLSFTRLAGGGAHTCGLTSDGTAYCWGSNTRGQLGDGSTINRNAPSAVATSVKFATITTGVEHTCALAKDGVAFCWGRNDRGQLADNGTTARSVPSPIASDLHFRAIAAGGFSIGQTCALTTTGAAYCWGDNERGQLGSGTPNIVPHPIPAPVSTNLSFSTISAGLGRHVCALDEAGVGYCWGENTFGALGNGSMFNVSTVPTRVSSNVAFTQIVAGGFIGHTCAMTSAGVAWCWGENEVGAIGDGSTEDRGVPVLVAGGLTFTAITAGFRHTCGVTSAGAVYCWGSNGAGQLGINSTAQRSAPTRVVSQP
jgi:alpha-tubulin suppressor-like RCC1 family protein